MFRVLEYQTHFLAQAGQVELLGIDGFSVKEDVARIGLQQTVQVLDEGGLAGAGSADKAHAFTGINIEGNILQDSAFVGCLTAIGIADIFDFQNGISGIFRSSRFHAGCGSRFLRKNLQKLGCQFFIIKDGCFDCQSMGCQSVCQGSHLRGIHFDPLQQFKVGEDLSGGTLLYDFTLFHQDDGICIHHFIGVVGDKDHSDALFLVEMTDQFHHIPAGIGIQHGGGFIQHDAGCIGRNGTCNADPLLLAAGQTARRNLPLVQQLHSREA